jgi:SAM-dependent methyltransferase
MTTRQSLLGEPPADEAGIDVAALDYVAFIALLRETNRPPGGKQTVRFWIQNAHLGPHSKVLEIGSNTGFTSLELARACGCRVRGIDVSAPAVEVARDELARDADAIRRLVRFDVADACAIPAEAAEFDAVACGGALSFIGERGAALAEIRRVIRPWGFVCVSPLCFHTLPPQDLLDRLESIVGFPLPVFTADDWLELFEGAHLEPYVVRRATVSSRTEEEVAAYVDGLVAARAPALAPTVAAALRRRALSTFLVFNENQRYVEALQGVYRVRALPEQEELFTLVRGSE